jgi:acyl carrier protein
MAMTYEDLAERASARTELCRTLRELVVEHLDLPLEPGWLTDDQPLFGRGLELDSVDALELAVAVEFELDVPVTDDDMGVFASINYLADFVESARSADG